MDHFREVGQFVDHVAQVPSVAVLSDQYGMPGPLARASAAVSINVMRWITSGRALYWHDPLTVLEALKPGSTGLQYVRGRIFVHVEKEGNSSFLYDPKAGP